MSHHISPGDLVLDVGAEEGDLSALYATWGAKVVLVEPNPKVWPSIRATWEMNDLRPVAWWVGFLAEQVWAIKDDPEGIRFDTTGWPACAYGELIPGHGFQHLAEHSEVTPALTIDRMVRFGGVGLVEPPALITMDVEGAELRVLKGAAQTLREFRPKVFASIHPAFMADLYAHSKEALLDFMAGLGYTATFLATDHEEHWMFLP
jgi:FkbM family methyltransferase